MSENVEAGATRKRRTWSERFWGNMAPFDRRVRIAGLVLVAVSIASMSFTQLGFWSIGFIDEKPVYLLLLLGPIAMGALLFGPLTGGLLGLFAGAVVFAHATFLPLDYYEVYFMTTLNTFALLTLAGALTGALFRLALRRCSRTSTRAAAIACVCLVVSFIISGLVQVNTFIAYGGIEYIDTISEYLLNSPAGVVVQALIDAALMALLCFIVDYAMRRISTRGTDRKLLTLFREWMFLISFVVFFASSAILFVAATNYTFDSAVERMKSDVDYIVDQLSRQGDGSLSYLLEGFDVSIDGRVAITDEDGIVLASDDERLPVGEQFLTLIGYEEYNTAGGLEDLLGITSDSVGEPISLQAVNEKGEMTMDIDVMVTGVYDNGYIAIIRSSNSIYSARFGIMGAVTALAIALIAAIALLATRLLNQVVVRRIDETNNSLGKITDGDLNERVRVHDSREFKSLSTGINTTVAALKGTIAEVEQKNAQDLATSKAIQESALPRDFPPFPDIDRFDIYASMKTAKEVGGDFYNFFLIDDTHLGFLIADVSGKGIPAALFMMTAKTQIQTYMESGLPVGEAVNAANHQLCIGNDAGMFVTAFICVLNYETGELSYVNAGHNPPMFHRGETWEWIRNVSGMPLGLFDGIPYDEYTMQLQKNDVLYLYTDGVTEAMSAENELFSEERLEKVLQRFSSMNPRSICLGVRRALTDYTVGAEQSDDITMLCLKYDVPPEKKAYMVLPAIDTQLVHVRDFIHEELHRRNAPRSTYNPLDIAAEELFTNVCHYAYPDATPDNPGEVRIGFEYEANPPSLTVTISDDGIPFNPLEIPDAPTVDQYDSIDDVILDGLGILMAKRCVDDISYEYTNGSNVLTFRKGW